MHRFTSILFFSIVFIGNSFAQNAPIQIIRIELSGQTYTDETVIYTDSSATMSFDGAYDAEKIPNADPQPNLASYIDDTLKASINAIPPIAIQTTIPLSVTTGLTGSYTLTATELSNFATGADVVLDDSLLSVSQSLFTNNTYSFSMSETDPDGRFYLNLYPATISVDRLYGNTPALKLRAFNNQLDFKIPAIWGEIEDVEIYSIHGTLIGSSYTVTDKLCTVKHQEGIASGIYLINVKATNKELSQKFFVK